MEYNLIISNVNLIDGTGSDVSKGANIFIKGNIIAHIDYKKVKQGPNVIDGTDMYVIPGLFDSHVHISNYETEFKQLIHYGVTSIFVPGGEKTTDEYYDQMRNIGSQDSTPAPRVFHTSQIFTVKGKHPSYSNDTNRWRDGENIHFISDTLQIERLIHKVTLQPITGVKLIIEDGVQPPFTERIQQFLINKVNREAKKNKTRVFAHISDNVELKMALEAGIANFVHFTGVDIDFEDEKLIESIRHKNISWVTTLMLDKSMIYPNHPEWVTGEMINIYGAQSFKIMNEQNYKSRAEETIQYFKDSYSFQSPTLKNIVEFQVDDINLLAELGVNMVLGTDAGNPFILPGHSIHEEMQLLELGGMDRKKIIKMGTYNAARMLNVSEELGTVEVGKLADIILLDKNPLDSILNTLSINTVIKNGKVQKRND
ncbi:amidohydrolase family protein [uncultured Allomuricauda sp.]|uniref:amidohydrolase family protein n=1 Tax=Flagellimonas sp. W118 TaxID=3410791 RepID=UPI002627F792|nr:amidohydrolase family protein [uncultured Allomuricauda sp.]